MRHFILGTAGHVDHGKTALVEALTGIDADRLKEEKKRGITIDLGFAYMDMDKGDRLAIIDVPGHEKLIKNMLAGAGGMDAFMLVIAADEGVMPQTVEHMEILSCLGITNGIIALNKCDMVDEEMIPMIIGDIRHNLAGTIMENTKIFPVSAKTGMGIEELRQGIFDLLLSVEDKEQDGAFFLPIDRSFTVKGFGTVVTGSVWSGEVSVGDEPVLFPDERKLTVRGVQVHGENKEKAGANQRAAINLKDINKDEIKRGQVLATKGSVSLTMMLDCRLHLLDSSPFSIKNNGYVRVYYGTGEYVAKVILMDCEELEAGQECFVQLRFKESLVARPGDRMVIRNMSPVSTIGGGTIIDANPTKKKHNNPVSINSFEVKESRDKKRIAYEMIRERHDPFITLRQLEAAGLSGELEGLIADNKILALAGERYITVELEEKLRKYFENVLINYHKDNPELPGMPVAEARMRIFGKKREQDAKGIVALWKDKELIKEAGASISLMNFELTEPKDDSQIRKRLIEIYEKGAIMPPAYNEVKPTFLGSKRFIPVLKGLFDEGILIKLDERYIIHCDSLKTAQKKLIKLGAKGEFTLGDYRDALKTSRKVALALLEYFDKMGVTKPEGEGRIVIETKSPKQ